MSSISFSSSPNGSQASDHTRRLARVYELILSWEIPRESNSESTVTDLGRDAAVDPEESLTHSDVSISRSDPEMEAPNEQEPPEL
jgi:hypothetical protein